MYIYIYIYIPCDPKTLIWRLSGPDRDRAPVVPRSGLARAAMVIIIVTVSSVITIMFIVIIIIIISSSSSSIMMIIMVMLIIISIRSTCINISSISIGSYIIRTSCYYCR